MYIVYCDESDRVGKIYSYFFGSLIVKNEDFNKVENFLYDRVTDNKGVKYSGEIKWYKVSDSQWKLSMIERFVDGLFQLIDAGMVKIRINFCQNIWMTNNGFNDEEMYFRLYYQAIKKDFCIFDNINELRLDRLPFGNEYKISEFGDFLKFANVKNGFVQIDSAEHILAQAIDIIIGAIAFKLNKKDDERQIVKCKNGNAKTVIGKRTKAKLRIYKYILSKIRSLSPSTIYQHFNIGTNTSTNGDEIRKIKDKYRHNLIVSKEKAELYRKNCSNERC